MISKTDTKQLLADSLRDLLQHKKYAGITIKDIVENCGVSRHAFYYHFKDKQELVSWIYLKSRHESIHVSSTECLDGNLRRLTRIMIADAALYTQAHASDDQNSVMDVILAESNRCLHKIILDYLGGRTLPQRQIDLIANYYTDACIGFLFRHLNGTLDIMDDEFLDYQTELLEIGLYTTLDRYAQKA